MRSSRVCLLLGLLPALLPARAAEPVPDRRWLFALVIGHNGTDDPEVQSLRYADDDAVQNARLFTQRGAPGGVILLTRLDSESRALYPDVDPAPPTRSALTAAVKRLNAGMDEARARGGRPVLYFFYSGHGDVENNQGYVHLEDGRLYRSDILEILKNSRATTNHVIVDACKSYFLVFDRGAGGERRPLTGRLLGDEESLPPNTGVLLSTSAAMDSHEWEALQAGVFSHEVRSALRGAADVDGDDRITYEEAAAFVWTANRAIVNRRFRPCFYARPPAGPGSVLFDLRESRGRRLVVDADIRRHLYIEDADGRRLADLHPGGDRQLALVLPPGGSLFVRFPGADEELELPPGRETRLSGIAVRKTTVRRRGAEHAAFRLLFSRPFDAQALQEYRDRPVETLEAGPEQTDWTWVRRGLGIAALVLGAAGGALTGAAAYQRSRSGDSTTGLERERINDRISRYNTAAVTCYSLAGTALVGYLLWTLWPEEEVDVQVLPTGLPGVQLMVRF